MPFKLIGFYQQVGQDCIEAHIGQALHSCWAFIPPRQRHNACYVRSVRLFSPAETVRRIFRVEHVPELQPRYNVAPTQDVPVVRVGTDGWYEWQLAVDGKQPWFIRRKDSQPFAFAGLWESWTDREDGTQLESCAIITGDAAAAIHDIHPRMPIPLPEAAWDEWLSSAPLDAGKLSVLLHFGTTATFEAWPVSRPVNMPKNQGPQLIERI